MILLKNIGGDLVLMEQKKFENQFKRIIDIFKDKGCSFNSTLSFIYNNFDYLIENQEKIEDNLYFIYNNKELYGVLIAWTDKYEWSIYENGNFYPIKSNIDNDNKLANRDYIVEMMLHFAEEEKVRRIIPDVISMNIDAKIRALKKIGLNSTGYHFR